MVVASIHFMLTNTNAPSPNAGYSYTFTAHYAFTLPSAFTAPNTSALQNTFGPNVIITLSVMVRFCCIIVHKKFLRFKKLKCYALRLTHLSSTLPPQPTNVPGWLQSSPTHPHQCPSFLLPTPTHQCSVYFLTFCLATLLGLI